MSTEAKYDENGKAIAGYEVIEQQTNGETVRMGYFPAGCRESAENLVASLNDEFGWRGVEYYVKVRRFA